MNETILSRSRYILRDTYYVYQTESEKYILADTCNSYETESEKEEIEKGKEKFRNDEISEIAKNVFDEINQLSRSQEGKNFSSTGGIV